jgi:hypothetical protein
MTNLGFRALALILENPFTEKGYRDLQKYYQANNMGYEASCIDELIKERFHASSLINKEQQNDNKKVT